MITESMSVAIAQKNMRILLNYSGHADAVITYNPDAYKFLIRSTKGMSSPTRTRLHEIAAESHTPLEISAPFNRTVQRPAVRLYLAHGRI